MSASPVAAIDIGTNSVLLFVGRRTDDGSIESVFERATITRIGRGVDRTGHLDDAGIDATLRTLEEYADEAARAGATHIGAVATSALRDAHNGASFLEPAQRILGVEVEVITGRREAELTFRGAVQGLDLPSTPDERVTIVDVGGGSTELVCGYRGQLDDAVSLDVGSVRLFERHLSSDPPTGPQLEAARAEMQSELQRARVQPIVPLVGIAGTVTTLGAIAHEIEPYDPARIHGLHLSRNDLERLASDLASRTLEQRKTLRGLEPQRADVIVAGALVVACVVEHANAEELIVSHGGVRVGLADELSN